MTRIERSILVAAPLKEVFEYEFDLRKWPEWFEGVSDFTPATETDHGNGARYVYKAQMMGMTVTLETEIQDYVENQGWTSRATPQNFLDF
ncbi:MAG: SRPBCC family protein [Cyclobacteriaceae bacterium]|nr:SRPBCC family protein [Cyclobacteriaceae bacterium]